MTLCQFLEYLERSYSKKKEALWPLRYYLAKNTIEHQPPPKFKDMYASTLAHSIILEKESNRLLELLDSINVTCLFYKGLDIESRFYPGPGTRPQSDIDILVDPADISKINALLLKNGYAFAWSGNYHYVYKKDRLCIEIHIALCSYKYLLYFDLLDLDYSGIVRSGRISSELYLLCSAIQFLDENSSRPMPIVDIYQIISSGVDPSAWAKLVKGRSAGLPIYFSHFWMKERVGYSPWTEELLAPLDWNNDKQKAAARLVRAPDIARQKYWVMLKTSRGRLYKLFKTAFPPREAYSGNTLFGYHVKTLRRLRQKDAPLPFSH